MFVFVEGWLSYRPRPEAPFFCNKTISGNDHDVVKEEEQCLPACVVLVDDRYYS